MSELQKRFDAILDANRRCATSDEVLGAYEWLRFARDYLNANPEPGMLMTYRVGSDRYGYEVVEVQSRNMFACRLGPDRLELKRFTYRPKDNK